MTRDAIRENLVAAKRKGMKVICKTEINNIVYGHANLVKRALCNLISNAIKYSDGGQVLIMAEYDRHDAKIMIRVKDTGIAEVTYNPPVPGACNDDVMFTHFVKL